MTMKCCIPVLLCLAFSANIHAQAKPTATRQGVLQAGLGLTNGNSDYAQARITGISAYGTFDFFKHLGAEVDIHYVSLDTKQDFGENTYEAGLRYVYRHGRFEPYAKAMVGIGTGDFQQGIYTAHSVNYGIYSFGAGLDLRLAHHINVRAIDYEYQQWPSFPPNNLTPSLITVGVAYRFR